MKLLQQTKKHELDTDAVQHYRSEEQGGSGSATTSSSSAQSVRLTAVDLVRKEGCITSLMDEWPLLRAEDVKKSVEENNIPLLSSKVEINWVQLGRQVYARYWEIRSTNNSLESSSCAHDKVADCKETYFTNHSPYNEANAAHIIEEVLSQYILVPLSGKSELLPATCSSIGSLLHDAGICKPCVFANKSAKTCRNQMMCYFCHEVHKERRKKRFTFRSTTPDVEISHRDVHTYGNFTWRNLADNQVLSKQRHAPRDILDTSRGGSRQSKMGRGSLESVNSTAPSTNRDDRQSALRAYNSKKRSPVEQTLESHSLSKRTTHSERAGTGAHNFFHRSSYPMRPASPSIFGVPSLASSVDALPLTTASHMIGDSRSMQQYPYMCASATSSTPEHDLFSSYTSREAILTALFLKQTFGSFSNNELLKDDLSASDFPPGSSRTSVGNTDTWESPSHDSWPLTAREALQSPMKATPLASVGAKNWSFEQEMLSTLINSILGSASSSAHYDQSDGWKMTLPPSADNGIFYQDAVAPASD